MSLVLNRSNAGDTDDTSRHVPFDVDVGAAPYESHPSHCVPQN